MRDGFVHEAAATRVVFARGALARVGDEVRRLGAKRVMLVAGGPEAVYADRIAGDLGDLVAGRLDEVVMHVPVTLANDAVRRVGEAGADALLCLGGGSATGLAKAVALRTGLPIVAVPTTYAGSEMTPIWGLTDDNRKTTGRDPAVLPRVVVYDPELTVSLPAHVSAASGMNAMAHCVEGLYAPGASPVTTLLAADGIRALARALPRVVVDGTDLEARAEALYGAWLAGWTLGTAGMGVHHKICHTLGGTWDMPHAPTHAAVLPYAIAYNRDHAPQAMARAATALGVDAGDVPGALWDLNTRLGNATALAALGFHAHDADDAATIIAAAPPVNPRPVDRDGVRHLLIEACAGHRPAIGAPASR